MLSQAEVNIGMLGHVDHGKTSLTKALTGVWTDTHSEELKRGITIKLGYADAVFRKCDKCKGPEAFTVSESCGACGGASRVLRRVSFIDAPGHETLMATAIAASAIMDGAVLVIAANEECPRPQTLEHLMILEILGVKRIVIAQTKIDLVSREKAKEHYEQIKAFVKGTVAENAPVVPVVANFGFNVDALIGAIEETIPTPERDAGAPARMYVSRSFDVNRPGTDIGKLSGGVVGGSLIQGRIRVGDELELRPGMRHEEKGKSSYSPIVVKVESLAAAGESLEEVVPGGLVAIATKLDPALTKADGLTGNLAGRKGTLPESVSELTIELHLIQRVGFDNPPMRMDEPLVLGVGTATTLGFIEKSKKNIVRMRLKRPVCVDEKTKIAVSRRIGQRWRLSGYGVVKQAQQ
ncbi:MAG: translation initiation factor IF-2 subunit gamma [Candidatus ainarchaeum sp.]|nr:translation initiation factor IF-2 subunit gamma [Candidatus ainarchaeum sp.]